LATKHAMELKTSVWPFDTYPDHLFVYWQQLSGRPQQKTVLIATSVRKLSNCTSWNENVYLALTTI